MTLARETYKFTNELPNNRSLQCSYEVNFIFLPILNKVFDSKNYAEYLKKESNKVIEYDMDINIRDLYPLEIHTDSKPKEIIDMFNLISKKQKSY